MSSKSNYRSKGGNFGSSTNLNKLRFYLSALLITPIWIMTCSFGGNTPFQSSDDDSTKIEFYISVKGSVLNKNGNPISGANVNLMESKLSAISDGNGDYHLYGNHVALSRALMTMDSLDNPIFNDTFTITIDSKVVVEEIIQITTGSVMELSPKYVVQREIRGLLSPDDQNIVGSIKAIVYDTTAPEKIKHINLWHDVMNQAFTAFAYFSSDSGKIYCLYVMVYDTAGRFIGRSPDFIFPDQIGNIVFTEPFAFNNAVPIIDITDNFSTIWFDQTGIKWLVNLSGDDTLKWFITIQDPIGKLTECKVVVNERDTLLNRLSIGSNTFSDTVSYIFNDTILSIKIEAMDDDNNVVNVIRDNQNYYYLRFEN